jgi:hypothetical protein
MANSFGLDPVSRDGRGVCLVGCDVIENGCGFLRPTGELRRRAGERSKFGLPGEIGGIEPILPRCVVRDAKPQSCN